MGGAGTRLRVCFCPCFPARVSASIPWECLLIQCFKIQLKVLTRRLRQDGMAHIVHRPSCRNLIRKLMFGFHPPPPSLWDPRFLENRLFVFHLSESLSFRSEHEIQLDGGNLVQPAVFPGLSVTLFGVPLLGHGVTPLPRHRAWRCPPHGLVCSPGPQARAQLSGVSGSVHGPSHLAGAASASIAGLAHTHRGPHLCPGSHSFLPLLLRFENLRFGDLLRRSWPGPSYIKSSFSDLGGWCVVCSS